MSYSGLEIITTALKKAGVLGQGRDASAVEANDGLADLNDMLAQWRTDRLMVPVLTTLGKQSTGVQWYTVGPGGDYDTGTIQRPNRIESAFLRQTNTGNLPVDYPLTMIYAREQYNILSIKSLQSFPKYCFYQTDYPLGQVTTYPVMNLPAYSLYLTFKSGILGAVALATAIDIPEEYFAAMKFNLAKRMRQAYGKGRTPDVELNALARDSLSVIQNSNLQVPELVMPKTIVRPGLYNILSDQSY